MTLPAACPARLGLAPTQQVGGNAVPDHSARLLARVTDLHSVPAPGEVVGGGRSLPLDSALFSRTTSGSQSPGLPVPAQRHEWAPGCPAPAAACILVAAANLTGGRMRPARSTSGSSLYLQARLADQGFDPAVDVVELFGRESLRTSAMTGWALLTAC